MYRSRRVTRSYWQLVKNPNTVENKPGSTSIRTV